VREAQATALGVHQAETFDQHAATRAHELIGRAERTVDLARLLRELHALPAPPVDLPATDPLGSLPAELDRPGPLAGEQRDWLGGQVAEIAAAYARLDPPGSRGLIHGDARLGNLLPVAASAGLLREVHDGRSRQLRGYPQPKPGPWQDSLRLSGLTLAASGKRRCCVVPGRGKPDRGAGRTVRWPGEGRR
jgi:hypothetical protein